MTPDRNSTHSEAAGLVIRPVRDIEEYHACERIQREAWGFSSDLDVVPLTQMVAAVKAGGLVLGGFSAEGVLHGFSYGFRGRDESGELHYSHMTAVDPALKATGLGARLKWAQREAVLAQGMNRIVWTYDPLESLNGYFNFTKLGVIVETYFENLYGETGSALHRGTPTDRFLARWYLESERVRARARGEMGDVAVALAEDSGAYPIVLGPARVDPLAGPGAADLDRDEPRLLVQIPGAIQAIKQADPAAALEWRMATRTVFRHYLDAGWVVRECVRTRESPSRTLYLLDR